jgi:hypothetical protein
MIFCAVCCPHADLPAVWTCACGASGFATDRRPQHIEVQLDDEGNVKLDDCGRPRLKFVPPDYLISEFRVIAERQGEAMKLQLDRVSS